MSTQVSDLYKKHHEVSDNIKSIQESIKDLAEELDKAKAENKGLQSEIILLVKQIASLEKIVDMLNLAQKLKDQKDDQDTKADVTTIRKKIHIDGYNDPQWFNGFIWSNIYTR